MRPALLSLAVIAVLAGCTGPKPRAISAAPDAEPTSPTVEDARRFYASQPRYLRPIPTTTVPEGLVDLTAEACGKCHREIYEEWRISTHARAFLDDAQFMAELGKSTKPDFDVSWMCMNCHTPVENQLMRLVTSLAGGRWERPIYVDNPAFDEKLAKEAITCATCHVKDGVVLGPWGTTIAPHPVRAEPSLLTVDVCTQCHQAKAEFAEINLACTFDTGAEHAASPYAADGKTCQSCHMPEIERRLTDDPLQPVRKTRRHWFGGSLIPKRPEFEAEIAAIRGEYPEGMALRWVEFPRSFRASKDTTVKVELENANAGHLLPTGDPERFILVKLEARHATTGAVLATIEERIGAVYEWWPKVRKVSDNRLRPKETRTLALTVPVPAKGGVKLSLVASKWRISEENMKFHALEGRYVAGRVFFEEEKTVPVRK
ncbi:cytochrome C554 and C-prime [Myxococcota bacterium]|nr:cytochrome C554 and C-prime [Myxococcota bacterium]